MLPAVQAAGGTSATALLHLMATRADRQPDAASSGSHTPDLKTAAADARKSEEKWRDYTHLGLVRGARWATTLLGCRRVRHWRCRFLCFCRFRCFRCRRRLAAGCTRARAKPHRHGDPKRHSRQYLSRQQVTTEFSYSDCCALKRWCGGYHLLLQPLLQHAVSCRCRADNHSQTCQVQEPEGNAYLASSAAAAAAAARCFLSQPGREPIPGRLSAGIWRKCSE